MEAWIDNLYYNGSYYEPGWAKLSGTFGFAGRLVVGNSFISLLLMLPKLAIIY
jgi:hypothetical protein